MPSTCGELTYEVDKDDLIEVATALRNEGDFGFEMLMDVCGVDYLHYGSDEWETATRPAPASAAASSADPSSSTRPMSSIAKRFAVVYHLLSLQHNCACGCGFTRVPATRR